MKLALAALACGSVVAFTTAARADEPRGFALSRFEPAERGSEWFVLDSLDVRGRFRPAIGLAAEYAHDPLVFYRDGREVGAIVEHQVYVHAGASLVLFDRLRAGVNLPIALYQTGDGVAFRAPKSELGDVRVATDVRLFGEHGKPITGAVGGALYLPTGSPAEYTGDGTVRFTPRATIAGDLAFVAYSARLGFQLRPRDDRFTTAPLGSEVAIAASAGIRALQRRLLVGPELFATTGTRGDAFFAKTSTPVDWLLGVHYRVGEVRLGAGAGSGLSRGIGSAAFRALLSVEWAPSFSADADGDRIDDAEDACPRTFGVRTGDPKTNGCPSFSSAEWPSDRDGDGIADREDACPDRAGPPSGDREKSGCPLDRDGDGVADLEDACPDLAGVANNDPAKNGCPPDRDGDGIGDAKDACPDLAGSASDDPLRNGCPSDRDGDGIYDKEDNCPDAPGPADPDPHRNGCPLARVEDGEIKIVEQVKFKSESAELSRESDPILFAIAAILKAHPEIVTVQIEGHTDNRGKPEANRSLSYQRAAAVMRWLVASGIDPKRLSAKGFGSARSIDTNDTDEGRRHNRRVELHVETMARAPARRAAP